MITAIAGQEAGDDRRRQELRDPAQTQQPDERHERAHRAPPGSRRARRTGGSQPAPGAATPTANSGAIVESAPTDICGLDPSSANITVPATNA